MCTNFNQKENCSYELRNCCYKVNLSPYTKKVSILHRKKIDSVVSIQIYRLTKQYHHEKIAKEYSTSRSNLEFCERNFLQQYCTTTQALQFCGKMFPFSSNQLRTIFVRWRLDTLVNWQKHLEERYFYSWRSKTHRKSCF